MKKLQIGGSSIRGLAAGLALLSCVPLAKATTLWFDVNGTTAGYGVTASTTYSWEGSFWATATGGTTATGNWAAGDFAEFNSTTTPYTVQLNATESVAGLFQNGGSAVTLNITNAPGFSFSIPAGPSQASQNGFSWLTQGFLTGGGTVNIYAPMSGAGGVEEESGGANLNLYGSNSFVGGFLVSSSSTVIGYNNNSSFGANSSQIGLDGTTFANFNNTGPASVTISNAVQTIGNTGVNFLGSSSAFIGNWYLGGGGSAINIRNNGVGTTFTLGGVLSATSGTVNYSGANSGTILLTNANTYTGETMVGWPAGSDNAITLEIGSTGSIASTVISNSNLGGTLKLDGPACLVTNASLELPASPAAGSVKLTFSGTQSIAALYIGGVLQTGGTYGSSTSTATFQLAAFTGNGVLSTPAAPSITQQPSPEAAFPGGSATFSVSVTGAVPFTYQWYSNNVAIGGATLSSYTASPVTTNNTGSYYVAITNSAGFIISSTVSLSLIETNNYTQTIVSDGAIAYYRLDETSGTTAIDAINGYNGTYTNVTLGQPGFSLLDTDTCIGLPSSSVNRGYANVPLPANGAFNFTSGNTPFTLEAWAYFTNLTGVQRLFSTLGNGNGYAFGINGNSVLRFTQGSVQDADATLASSNNLVTGVWYYLAVACDGFNYYYYLNGNPVGQVQVGGVGVPQNGVGNPAVSPMALGADPVQYTFTAEQVYGNLDEMAIYSGSSGCLTPTQIMNHYNARYGNLSAPVVSTPVASPATNYASLSSTIQAVAAGQALSYQWFQAPSTMLSGQTAASLTISPLTNTASYYVTVSNPKGTNSSPSAMVTVLPIPTNYTDLNLTNKLVLHLPFDGDSMDATGRGNNGTNMGSPGPSYVSPGAVGASALHYSSAPGSFNYVDIGVRPDLQFGTSTNFSVSFWVREASGTVITNLPFFADTITGSGVGFDFNPFATSATSGGGWQWELGDIGSPNQFNPTLEASDVNLINDGNWHHLAFVADRSANLTTFLDGAQVDSLPISFLVSIDTGTNAVVGQDASRAYAVTAAADIDDLGVWQRTLSSLEVSGIYLGGISNSVSFAASQATIFEPLNVQVVGGQVQLSWNGTANLQGSTNAAGPYTNIVPAATSPYTVTSPSPQMFYRLHP